MMWMNKLLPKLLIFAIAIVSVCGADNSNSAAAGVSKKRAVSNHLLSIRHETFANAIDTLRAGARRKLAAGYQLFSKSSKKADGKSGKADSSTKSDKAKSAKAYSKAQKEANDSALFTSCADVQAELDAYKAAATAPHWLFVQMADMCTLYLKDGVYHLESSNFHKDTEWFTDRPMQLEKTEATSDWFNNFNELFDDEKGMPNAALTIVDDDMSKDVVVSVFAEGYVKEGEGDEGEVTTYGYKLEQSTDQESVMALASLMEDGEDSVTFDHCSMFIDM